MAIGYSNQEIEACLDGQSLLGFIQKPYTMAQLKERLYPLFEKYNSEAKEINTAHLRCQAKRN
jgi:hypothetical protein